MSDDNIHLERQVEAAKASAYWQQKVRELKQERDEARAVARKWYSRANHKARLARRYLGQRNQARRWASAFMKVAKEQAEVSVRLAKKLHGLGAKGE